MAISPPSDIVLDVARAADPQRMQLAFERLQRLGVPGGAATQFASLVDESGAAKGLSGAREHFAALAAAEKAAAADTPAAKTARQFEAQVASTFIQQIMPEAKPETYGSGLSGDVWRSMMADQIAGQISKGAGLGIREKVQASIAARQAAAEQAQATTTAEGPRHLPDRQVSAAGATGRDLNIPLAVEQRFLNITKPAAAGSTSLTRKA